MSYSVERNEGKGVVAGCFNGKDCRTFGNVFKPKFMKPAIFTAVDIVRNDAGAFVICAPVDDGFAILTCRKVNLVTQWRRFINCQETFLIRINTL